MVSSHLFRPDCFRQIGIDCDWSFLRGIIVLKVEKHKGADVRSVVVTG